MNEAIVRNHNEKVQPDDTIYILGDLMLGQNYEQSLAYLKSLTGNKIFIMGNHDSNKRKELYKAAGFQLYDALTLEYHGYHFYLSHYPTLTDNYDDCDRPLKTRILSLSGHYHTQDRFVDMRQGIPSYHVELDAHNNYPVSIEEVINDIKTFQKDNPGVKQI